MNFFTSSSEPRRFVITVLLATLLPLMAVAGFVWLLDPYDVFGAPRIAGMNEYKWQPRNRQHIMKILHAERLKPRSIILGSSRAHFGLSPSHPGLQQPAYNLGYPGHTWQDSLDLLEEMIARKDPALRQAVLHLDAFNANALLLKKPSLAARALEVIHGPGLWISTDVREDALAMLRRQKDGPAPRYVQGYNIDAAEEGHWKDFELEEQAVLPALLIVKGHCRPMESGPTGRPQDVLERIFRLAHAGGLQLYIVIGPSHARFWELQELAGFGPAAADWKRVLVKLNERVAMELGRTAFPIWDFSGFNRLTTEEVSTDGFPAMRWHYEASHYRSVAGDIMLDRVFELKTVPGDWRDVGARLTTANIDAILASDRRARMAWRAGHPADLASLRATVGRVREAHGCAVPVEPAVPARM